MIKYGQNSDQKVASASRQSANHFLKAQNMDFDDNRCHYPTFCQLNNLITNINQCTKLYFDDNLICNLWFYHFLKKRIKHQNMNFHNNWCHPPGFPIHIWSATFTVASLEAVKLNTTVHWTLHQTLRWLVLRLQS